MHNHNSGLPISISHSFASSSTTPPYPCHPILPLFPFQPPPPHSAYGDTAPPSPTTARSECVKDGIAATVSGKDPTRTRRRWCCVWVRPRPRCCSHPEFYCPYTLLLFVFYSVFNLLTPNMLTSHSSTFYVCRSLFYFILLAVSSNSLHTPHINYSTYYTFYWPHTSYVLDFVLDYLPTPGHHCCTHHAISLWVGLHSLICAPHFHITPPTLFYFVF